MVGRVEPHTVGSIMHVIKRGTRGIEIVQDKEDRIRFMRSLYYLNEIYSSENWKRDTATLGLFERPASWPEREPLVNILAWTLLPNHFHLLLQERTNGGIAKFMQRLCNSMTKSFNEKYKEKGSLFQSSYKGKTVADDIYFRQLVWYIIIKNVLELYPGGITAVLKNYDKAWEWGLSYEFSSFGFSVSGEASPLIADEEGLIAGVCRSKTLKKDAKGLLSSYKFRSDELKAIALESW